MILSLTIGKKIGLGFGCLLATLCLIASYSAITMVGVSRDADKLADVYLPQIVKATGVERAILLTNIVATRYLFTTNNDDSAKVDTSLLNVNTALEEVSKIVDANPVLLAELGRDAKESTEAVDGYAKAYKQMSQLYAEYATTRDRMTSLANLFMKNAYEYLESQNVKLREEINQKHEGSEIIKSVNKTVLINEVIDSGNALLIANFQSQTFRDIKYIESELEKFNDINDKIEEILKVTIQQSNIDQLKKIKKSAEEYKKSLLIIVGLLAKVSDIEKEWMAKGGKAVDVAKTAASNGEKQTSQIAHHAASSLIFTLRFLVICSILAICLGIWVSIYVTKIISEPVNEIVGVIGKIADGDLTASCSYSSDDEIGVMSKALNSTTAELRFMIQAIVGHSNSVASASEELTAVTGQLSSIATETSSQAGVVAAATEEVNANINTVAAAVEEMSATAKEIAGNSQDAARVSSEAVGAIRGLNDTIGRLDSSSSEIGQVVGLITSIAEQTNLLALNATIEAARAGDAGKGFAVVANEVKELAKQTAIATSDIAQKVSKIQEDTKGTVVTINQFGSIIDKVNEISSSIAAAVEEQTVTTIEIARNMGEAQTGSISIARNISGVAEAAHITASQTTQSEASARELAKVASELNELICRFKC